MTIHGILNIHKPYGVTSMDVVRRIKRASRQRRVGHAGTLDPIATGVLPICIGQATRLMEHIVGGGKIYRAGIEFGASTDTYDALGETTARTDSSALTLDRIQSALPHFIGDILQVPPMYSALKRGGKRLYDLARDGIEVERPARPVVVHDITVRDWVPPLLSIDISCGKGFYVRSLAHDLGGQLGCGAHLKTLARLQSGAFSIEAAVSIDAAESAFAADDFYAILQPLDAALQDLPSVIVSPRAETLICNGAPIDAHLPGAPEHHAQLCRAYTQDRHFIALLRLDAPAHLLRPHKVFPL